MQFAPFNEQPTTAGPGEVRVRPYEQHRRGKLVPVRGYDRHHTPPEHTEEGRSSEHEGDGRLAAATGETVNQEAESQSPVGSRRYLANYEQGRKDADQWLYDEKNYPESERFGNPDFLKSHPGYAKGFMDAQLEMLETFSGYKRGVGDGLRGDKDPNNSDFYYLRGWEVGTQARQAMAEGRSLPPQVDEALSKERDDRSGDQQLRDSFWAFFGANTLGDVKFPSKEELAKRLNIKTKEIHQVKEDIKHVFKDELNRQKIKNPNIGYDRAGNLVLSDPVTKRAIRTGVPLKTFGR